MSCERVHRGVHLVIILSTTRPSFPDSAFRFRCSSLEMSIRRSDSRQRYCAILVSEAIKTFWLLVDNVVDKRKLCLGERQWLIWTVRRSCGVLTAYGRVWVNERCSLTISRPETNTNSFGLAFQASVRGSSVISSKPAFESIPKGTLKLCQGVASCDSALNMPMTKWIID